MLKWMAGAKFDMTVELQPNRSLRKSLGHQPGMAQVNGRIPERTITRSEKRSNKKKKATRKAR